MTTGEIKKGGFYCFVANLETREGDKQPQELIVKVLQVDSKNGQVEVIFPPFNTCRWLYASQLTSFN